jgi:hypothetical protein
MGYKSILYIITLQILFIYNMGYLQLTVCTQQIFPSHMSPVYYNITPLLIKIFNNLIETSKSLKPSFFCLTMRK